MEISRKGWGERVEPGALRLALPDFEVAAGHGLIPGAMAKRLCRILTLLGAI